MEGSSKIIILRGNSRSGKTTVANTVSTWNTDYILSGNIFNIIQK
jgi:cytidylate kinase